MILQWSKYNAGSNDVTKTVPLLLTFQSKSYYINLTSNSTFEAFNRAQPNWVVEKYNDSFKAHFDAYYNGGNDWIAIGF